MANQIRNGKSQRDKDRGQPKKREGQSDQQMRPSEEKRGVEHDEQNRSDDQR